MLRAVRSRVWLRSFAFERADLDDHRILVVFTVDWVDVERYGVLYSLAALPMGPMTGEPCGTPEQWAAEIGLNLDELVETGGVARAEHIPGPDGVVLLRW